MIRRGLRLLAAALLAVLLMGSGDVNDPRFRDIGNRMMCMCGCRQVLLQCNHVGCSYSDRMRNELAAGVARGDTEDSIFAAFAQKYGPLVRNAPDTKGFNLVAWLMPVAVLFLVVPLVLAVLRRWRAVPAGAPVAPAAEYEAFRGRIRRETEL